MTELRDGLRLATAGAHRELDAALASSGLLDSAVGYRGFLHGWYRLQTGVEQRADANGVERLLPDWPRRRRAHLLSRDLAALGDGVPAALPAEALPMRLSPAGLLGMLYVVEGASLGAAVVLRRLTKLNIATAGNTAFLTAATAHPSLWPAFVAALRQHEVAVNACEAIDAALATFAWAKACFVSPDVLPAHRERPRGSLARPRTSVG